MGEMLDQLGLPKVPHVIYENPPLVLTVCQIRFGSVLGVADPKYVAPFQKAIQERYPVATGAEQAINYDINVTPAGPELRKTSLQHWRFTDRGDDWTVVLTQDFISLETRRYYRFEDFIERLSEVLGALTKYIRPSLGTRIGLRYVNEIRPGSADWSVFIRRELLGPVVAPFASHIKQAVQQVQLGFRDGAAGVNIHHGTFPIGTTVQPRSGGTPPPGPFYLLDFDVYKEFEAPDFLPMEPNQICYHVGEFKQVIYGLFRWSVTDEYTSTLEERHNDRD